MKKIALFLSLLLILSLAACAQQAGETEPTAKPQPTLEPEHTEQPVETQLLSGVVLEIVEDGIYIETEEHGEVLVLTGEETVFETTGDIRSGDLLYIDYNGQMTFSLPAQISASVVRMHKLEGDVIEVYPEENAVLLGGAAMDAEVYVHLPEIWKDAQIDFEHMTVYYNGVMTMSLPGQINAGLVLPGYSLQGAISEIGEGYVLLGDGPDAVQVLLTEGQLPETAEIGAVVRVRFDGQMTRSIPMQITAQEIVQLSR